MDKYKWDLSKIFKNEKEFYDAIKKIEINLTKLSEYKGHIIDSKNSLYEFYTLDDEHVKEVFEVAIEHIEHKR